MSFDIEGLDRFMSLLEEAGNGGFKKVISEWLEAMGMEFLDIIQDEIIRTETVDTRRLLNSFQKGDSDNVWNISSGSLNLEVGTNVEYASYRNDGHHTIDPKKGLDRRWVPGRWSGSRFVYDSSERNSGMSLKMQWVNGTGYWDNALTIFEKMFSKGLENLLQEWVEKAF